MGMGADAAACLVICRGEDDFGSAGNVGDASAFRDEGGAGGGGGAVTGEADAAGMESVCPQAGQRVFLPAY